MRYGMTRVWRWIAIGTAVSLALGLSPGAFAADDDAWTVKWANGFKVQSADKKFKLAFGGRIQADWTFVDQDDANEAFYGPIESSNEFRRARLFVSGVMYERIKFKAQYDFGDGDADFKDMYIEFMNTPIGNVRAGHFKEPFSLEELTSSKYITFMERSLPNAFSRARNTGVMLHDRRGDRFTWAVGAFRETDAFGGADAGETADASSGKVNIAARVTGLPWYEDGGKRLFHLGLSAASRDVGKDSFRFRARPEVHKQSQRFVDTGSFSAEDALVYDIELAVVVNKFWAAAEYMTVEPDSVVGFASDPSFNGGYIQAGYFLTDDHRRYKTSAGTFNRTKPSQNYGGGGVGAWEIAVRYSTLDLSDALPNDPEGGELDNLSLGVNWYPNPATRVMLNYITSEPDIEGADPGETDFITLRLQVDF